MPHGSMGGGGTNIVCTSHVHQHSVRVPGAQHSAQIPRGIDVTSRGQERGVNAACSEQRIGLGTRHKGRAQGDARVSKRNKKNLKKGRTSVGAQMGAEAHRGQSVNAAGRGQGC